MKGNFKDCFTTHVVMHSLFGLGLGIILATYFTGLQNVWYGVILLIIAVAADMMRKN